MPIEAVAPSVMLARSLRILVPGEVPGVAERPAASRNPVMAMCRRECGDRLSADAMQLLAQAAAAGARPTTRTWADRALGSGRCFETEWLGGSWRCRDVMCYKWHMVSVGVRELRQRASELLRLVEQRRDCRDH